MNKINRINQSMNYIVLHLGEYAGDVDSLKHTMQEYLDEALELVENYEASEDDALRILKLARLANEIMEII